MATVIERDGVLPFLKVGQVWQLRKQSFHGVVIGVVQNVYEVKLFDSAAPPNNYLGSLTYEDTRRDTKGLFLVSEHSSRDYDLSHLLQGPE